MIDFISSASNLQQYIEDGSYPSEKVKFDLPGLFPADGLDVQGERFFSVHDDVAALERRIEEREDGHESRLLTG